jgi:hypothetical protein
MSKQQDYFISLTGQNRAAINVQVDSLVEKKKSRALFKILISKCQDSMNRSKSPQGFFEKLKINMEKFSEFTDFFDVTPVSMATAITQLHFHEMLVDNWDKQEVKIVATRIGEADEEYQLPPPSLVFHLLSKKRREKIIDDESDSGLGSVTISYCFADEDAAKLKEMRKSIPKKTLKEATAEMFKSVEELHCKGIAKLLTDCGFDATREDGIKISTLIPLNDEQEALELEIRDLKFEASEKMKELVDSMNIKSSDDFIEILDKIMEEPETRAVMLEDFKRWRAHKDGDEDNYRGLMPKPGEFIAEA